MSPIQENERRTAAGPWFRSALAAVAFAVALGPFALRGAGPEWRTIGNDPANNRNQALERKIGVDNVSHLAVKWTSTTAGDVSATPAVVDGAVYFGDFGGMEWKLDAATGHAIWSRKVSNYTGIEGDMSRSSPSLAGDTLVIGDLRAANMIRLRKANRLQ